MFMLGLCLPLLVFIHTLDMELTAYYIGDRWYNETFLPMSICIHWLGIAQACWISRLCVYSYVFFTLLYQSRAWCRYLLLTITLLYIAAMTQWLFSLNILQWPAGGF